MGILLLLYGAQPSVIGYMEKESRSLSGLLRIMRHLAGRCARLLSPGDEEGDISNRTDSDLWYSDKVGK